MTDFRAVAPKAVITFCAALLLGAYAGVAFKTMTNARAYHNALAVHFQILQTCHEPELRINYVREQLELKPLPTRAFCPTSLP